MTEISQLHQKKLLELEEDEARLPELREKFLKEDRSIWKQNEIRTEIDRILAARDNYYLTGVPLMHKAKYNGEAYNLFRSFLDPSYTFKVEVNDNYCCGEFRAVPSNGAAVCLNCSSQVYADLVTESVKRNVFQYKRLNYLRQWIENIQGKEVLSIPKNVTDTVRSAIAKEGKTTVNESDVLRHLKRNKIKLYGHSTKILAIVTGVKPARMTDEMESNLEALFESVQESYERHKGKRRKFFSYAYILYKMCELLEYTEFLPKLFMHKKSKLVKAQDNIWRMVCDDVGLEFIKTT